MTKNKTRPKRRGTSGLTERLWAAIWVDGVNGIRKGNKVFQVVTVDGQPVAVARGVPKVAVRGMQDHDFVDLDTAIAVLEDVLYMLRDERTMEEEHLLKRR